jgi:hypothetical protein
MLFTISTNTHTKHLSKEPQAYPTTSQKTALSPSAAAATECGSAPPFLSAHAQKYSPGAGSKTVFPFPPRLHSSCCCSPIVAASIVRLPALLDSAERAASFVATLPSLRRVHHVVAWAGGGNAMRGRQLCSLRSEGSWRGCFSESAVQRNTSGGPGGVGRPCDTAIWERC